MGGFEPPSFESFGFSKQAVSNSRNIYILSERGYSKLLKILEDDTAWEIYEKFVDGYFNMRSQIPKLSPELQAIFQLDSRTVEMNSRISKLENTMTIDYSQQEEINIKARQRVIYILGGRDVPAYKELSKKAFAEIWRDYKRTLDVNSYRNTAVKDFMKGLDFVTVWKPNRELELMIAGANFQMRV